ncbi:MAG: geranylgeranyl reductase family protein [bacterium]|nr:geranylgeranyl reductase family protein [bacterium]
MNSKIYDTVIIGAGPAGLAAAITMAKHNYSVLLVDKEEFPRDKICGDGLTGDTLRILKNFNLLKEVEEKGFISEKIELYTSKDSKFTLNNRVITLKRSDFDKILYDEAIRLGIKFIVGKYNGTTTKHKEHTELEIHNIKSDKRKFISAKYVIISTGCQSDKGIPNTLANKVSKPDLLAYRGYYKVDWPISNLKVYFCKEIDPGYIWLFPMGNSIFNIGCGGKINKERTMKLKHCLKDFITRTNAKYFVHGEWIDSPKGAFLRADLCNINAFKKSKNIIFAGEALGSTYPFTGEGIGKALDTGIIAGETCLHGLISSDNDYNLSAEYIRQVKKRLRKFYYPYRGAYLALTKTPFKKFFFKKICNSPRAVNFISKILDEEISPMQIFHPKRLLDFILK